LAACWAAIPIGAAQAPRGAHVSLPTQHAAKRTRDRRRAGRRFNRSRAGAPRRARGPPTRRAASRARRRAGSRRPHPCLTGARAQVRGRAPRLLAGRQHKAQRVGRVAGLAGAGHHAREHRLGRPRLAQLVGALRGGQHVVQPDARALGRRQARRRLRRHRRVQHCAPGGRGVRRGVRRSPTLSAWPAAGRPRRDAVLQRVSSGVTSMAALRHLIEAKHRLSERGQRQSPRRGFSTAGAVSASQPPPWLQHVRTMCAAPHRRPAPRCRCRTRRRTAGRM